MRNGHIGLFVMFFIVAILMLWWSIIFMKGMA